jgi:hypothetical protein
MFVVQEDSELLSRYFALTPDGLLEKVMLNIVRHVAPHYDNSPS